MKGKMDPRLGQLLDLLPGKIAHANSANLALLYETLHCSPRILNWDVDHVNETSLFINGLNGRIGVAE